jgi:hypothetical protein
MGIGDIARDLRHPCVVRVWGHTRDVDLSRCDIDEEEDVVVINPLKVKTSTLRKSVAVKHSQWAFRNVDHRVRASRAGRRQ